MKYIQRAKGRSAPTAHYAPYSTYKRCFTYPNNAALKFRFECIKRCRMPPQSTIHNATMPHCHNPTARAVQRATVYA